MPIEDTIVKLLSQAEGTQNEQEALAYTEKAKKLAATYEINLAFALQKAQDRGKREVPTTKRIVVGTKTPSGRGAPGNKYFVFLAGAIADSHDVKWDISYRSDFIDTYGFPSDLEVVELFFNSIAAQMIDACHRDLKAGKHREAGLNARDYKGNFYEAYRQVIKQRLLKARNEAIHDHDDAAAADIMARSGQTDAAAAKAEPMSAPGASLVLAAKADEIRDYYKRTSTASGSYGYSGHEVGRVSSVARAAGQTAAQSARLSAQKSIGGQRTALH